MLGLVLVFPGVSTTSAICRERAKEENGVRIISGSARGRQLSPLLGKDIRPTPDRVREALFSLLTSRFGSLSGLRVLDLFAGSGALALEALSRGAVSAVLVDKGPQSARVIPANIRACAMQERATFIPSDVLKALPRLGGSLFELVFLDPPYGQGLVLPVLTALAEFGLLAPAGLICAETDRREELPAAVGSFVRIDRRLYGSTAVHLFTHPEAEA
jgi:16S rRNA (guanine(966)-N(2))-methyltransferase RsmD